MKFFNNCQNSFIKLIILSLSFLMSLYISINELVYFLEFFVWLNKLMSFVFFISSLVIFYSMEYMSSDKKINRFILLVLMFVMSKMLLIISLNLISILLGWDILGLVSYCLVIYFQSVKSYNVGMLTALINRIGDVALLKAIAWMLNYVSSNYIYYLKIMKEDISMKIIGSLVVSAALPAAMAAPNPVSGLVHSSTLVTADVYLLIRFDILLIDSLLGNILLLLSGLTMFMAGLGANYFDLKKIIDLSTLSQLGLMMSILSMGFYKLAHGLFKTLLFMCMGAIIHNMKNFQGIRYMGGLSVSMSLTSSIFNVANLALCGMSFFFFAGFYSKDLILEVVSLSYVNMFFFLRG